MTDQSVTMLDRSLPGSNQPQSNRSLPGSNQPQSNRSLPGYSQSHFIHKSHPVVIIMLYRPLPRSSSVKSPGLNRRYSYLVKHCFDIDGQVSMGAAEPPHDAEAQPRRAPVQGDGFIHTGAE